MVNRIIHPRMMDYLEQDFFTQICALKKPTKAQDPDTNQETKTYAVQHDGVACRVGPAKGGERRTNNGQYFEATHFIVLRGQFSDVTEEWIAVVNEQEYQILIVVKDGEGTMTRLECLVLR